MNFEKKTILILIILTGLFKPEGYLTENAWLFYCVFPVAVVSVMSYG